MKTMTVGEFKAKFSDVIAQVKAGEEIAVTFGKKKEVIGYFKPEAAAPNMKKRVLGVIEGKATAVFKKDFEITEVEFLGV
jgi:hypothetical protein